MVSRLIPVALLMLLSRLATVCAGPIVSTSSGLVEGQRRIYNSPNNFADTYEEFLGIPFAAPPVGDLRWQPPQPVTPWPGILDASNYGQHCTQLIAPAYIFIGMSGQSGEDCLYINVWVPNGVADNGQTQLPVMVWIYGGAYMLGTGAMYPGHDLAIRGNVIVVNFNYRLNTLGWLSTDDSALPGNYGMWDIRAALVWVQDNIAAFSGDPNRVTIFGQSAGGSLVSHCVVSPIMTGLFHGAIAISGASSGFFGIQNQPLRTAAALATAFNCTNVQTSTDLVNCLKYEDDKALNLWGVSAQLAEGRVPNFAPVVDGVTVLQTPKDSWQQGIGMNIDYMTGFTYQDSAGFVILNPIALPALSDHLSWAATNESLVAAMSLILGATANPDELLADIFREFPGMNTADTMTRTLETTRVTTDWWFGSSSNWEANERANHILGRPTYQYTFKHRQSFLVGYPSWVNGSHVDDLYSVFGYPFMELYRQRFLNADFDQTDFDVSKKIQEYYTNFAYSGDPNSGPIQVQLPWTEFQALLQNYLQESPTFSNEVTDPAELDSYNYWMVEFPAKVQYPPPPTFPLTARLTEQELDAGVEKVRQWIRQQLANDDQDVVDVILSDIDQIVNKRKQKLFGL